MKITNILDLKLPIAQNFIRIESKQPYIIQEASIDIGSLTEEQIQEYAELVKQQLIDNWRERRHKV